MIRIIASCVVGFWPHITMQQLKPCFGKCLTKCFRVFHKAVANGPISRIHFERHISRGHHWHDFFATAIDFWCHIVFVDIHRMPDICTSRAFG